MYKKITTLALLGSLSLQESTTNAIKSHSNQDYPWLSGESSLTLVGAELDLAVTEGVDLEKAGKHRRGKRHSKGRKHHAKKHHAKKHHKKVPKTALATTASSADLFSATKSDPICSSAGCTQYRHPSKDLGYKINYAVPNFGRDHDIRHSEQSAVDAEKQLGHVFTPKWDEEDEKWIVPTEDVEFKLAGTAADIRLHQKAKGSDDDDSCDKRKKSSLLTEDEWNKCHAKVKAQKEKQLAQENAKIAKQAPISHVQLESGSDAQRHVSFKDQPRAACSSAGWCGEPWPASLKEKPEKVVTYNTGLPLDQDIRDSQGNLQNQEGIHGTWNINQSPDSYRGQRAAAMSALDGYQSNDVSSHQPRGYGSAQSLAKTSQKSGVSLSSKAQKYNSFVSMRNKMMSNWGAKQ